MALRPAQASAGTPARLARWAVALRLPAWRPAALLLAAAFLPLFAGAARAEDLRVEKLRRLNEEIRAGRLEAGDAGGADDAGDEPPPLGDAVEAARLRLAMIQAELAEKRLYGAGLAGPREELAAKSQALGMKVAELEEENRTRVAAIYRSAKVGAVAAGWQADRARSARLARYLAAIAAEQASRLEVLEVEHGSAIAALDRARADDAQVAEQLRVLEVEVAEAQAGLDRALAGGGYAAFAGGIPARPPGTGDTPAGAGPYGRPWDETDRVAEHPGPSVAAGQPDEDLERMADLLAGPEPSEDGKPSLEEERARLEAAARAAQDRAAAELEDADEVALADADADAADEQSAEESVEDPVEKESAGETADEGEGESREESEDEEEVAASSDDDADPAVAEAAEPTGTEDAGDSESALAESGSENGEDEEAAADDDDARPSSSRRRGLLTRLFGGDEADQDRESDEFAGSRGTLPAPVAGKVVANYGQQHKSGATYRGVILRAAPGESVEAVFGGTVSFAGPVESLGDAVIVRHGSRFHTVYARLGSLDVKVGQKVGRGARLGRLPDDNADMHFELRDQGRAVDPLPWLGSRLPGAPPE